MNDDVLSFLTLVKHTGYSTPLLREALRHEEERPLDDRTAHPDLFRIAADVGASGSDRTRTLFEHDFVGMLGRGGLRFEKDDVPSFIRLAEERLQAQRNEKTAADAPPFLAESFFEAIGYSPKAGPWKEWIRALPEPIFHDRFFLLRIALDRLMWLTDPSNGIGRVEVAEQNVSSPLRHDSIYSPFLGPSLSIRALGMPTREEGRVAVLNVPLHLRIPNRAHIIDFEWDPAAVTIRYIHFKPDGVGSGGTFEGGNQRLSRTEHIKEPDHLDWHRWLQGLGVADITVLPDLLNGNFKGN